ncbi:hypothetical protein [Desulfovulcanus sp.]
MSNYLKIQTLITNTNTATDKNGVFAVASFIGLIAFFCLFRQAYAADWKITPAVSLRETYNSNLFFKDIEDFEHLAMPSLTVEANTERSSTKLTSKWNIFRYSKYNDFDRENQAYQLDTFYSYTPKLSLFMQASVNRDYTFETTLEESGLAVDKSLRTGYSFIPGLSFNVDEKNRLHLTTSFSRTNYQKETNADNRIYGLNLSWSHLLNDQRTSITASAGYQNISFKPENGTGTQKVYQILGGLSYKFSEITNIKFQVGTSLTRSEYEISGDSIEDTTKGIMANGEVNWSGEKLDFVLGLKRDFYQSVYGENLTREKIRTSLMWNLKEHFSCLLDANYYRIRTEGYVTDQKKETYYLSPALRYAMTQDMSIELRHTYTQIQDKINDTTNINKKVYLQFNMKFPID